MVFYSYLCFRICGQRFSAGVGWHECSHVVILGNHDIYITLLLDWTLGFPKRCIEVCAHVTILVPDRFHSIESLVFGLGQSPHAKKDPRMIAARAPPRAELPVESSTQLFSPMNRTRLSRHHCMSVGSSSVQPSVAEVTTAPLYCSPSIGHC
jgi:hypothetical protein